MRTTRRGRRPGQDPRGMIAAVALVILGVLLTLGMALLTAAQGDRFNSTRTRSRAGAFYVADGGLQTVVNGLKTNATNVIRATFPVLPGLLVKPSDWGFTAANYPGGIVFSNGMDTTSPGCSAAQPCFQAGNANAYVVVIVPAIGQGTAQVTVWLKSQGATLAAPVVFGVTSVGKVPNNTSRTVMADVTLVANGGRPPNLVQTGGLEGPVLDFLTAGGTAVSGTVQNAGATVAIWKRNGNGWSTLGTVTAASAPAGGPYTFTLAVSPALVRGDTYSAILKDSGGNPLSAPAFPVVVE